jgi:uncharacterized protein with GYD domain
VKEVYLTYGVFDIIAKLEGDTQEKVKAANTYEIRALEEIKTTLTMIVV